MNFSVMVCHKIVCALMVIVCAYVVIKLNHVLTLAALLCYAFAMIATGFVTHFLYPFMADLSLEASIFRTSWAIQQARTYTDKNSKVILFQDQNNPNLNENKELIRLLRSCPDLHIKFGNFYNFTKTTRTTYSSITVDYTINLLLAF